MSGPLHGIGHNKTPEMRKAEFAVELALFVGNISLSKKLTRDELKKLEGIARHLALSKTTIIASIIRLRKHPRESAATPVFNLIAMLCDNDKGICTLSMNRIAELFNRTRKCIWETIQSLEEDGLLNVEKTNGMPSRYWPAIPAAIPAMNPASVWFVDALTETPKWKLAAPPTAAPCNREVTGSGRGGCEREVTGGVTERSRTCNREGNSISLLNISDEDNREGAATRALNDEVTTQKQDLLPLVDLGNVDELEMARRAWMRDPHGLAGGVNRAELERQVAGLANILAQNAQPKQVSEATATAILEMRGRAFEKASEKEGGSGAGFLKYFRNTVDTCLERIVKRDKARKVDDAELAERTRVSSEIQAKRSPAFDQAVTEGKARRAQEPPARDGQRDRTRRKAEQSPSQPARFDPDKPKIGQIGSTWIVGLHGNMILDRVPMATPSDVETILVEIGPDLVPEPSRFGATSNSKPPELMTIIEHAAKALGKKLMYAKHGTPEQLCGGTPHEHLSWDWGAISTDRVNATTSQFPHALSSESYYREHELVSIRCELMKLTSGEQWQRYGQALQQEIEAAFEQKIAERHAQSKPRR